MTLREVRLFHWRQLMAVRAMQQRTKGLTLGNREAAIKTDCLLRSLANEHLGAVQYLNDFCEGTAEQDDTDGISTHSVLSVDDVRADAISGAHNLAELLARYAAKLESELPGTPRDNVRSEKFDRAQLTRELAAILFRAAELERNRS